MDEPWKQLPRAAALVYVGVLATGSSVARAEPPPATDTSDASTGDAADETGSGDAASDETGAVAGEEDMYPIAPTCGPACHDPDWRWEEVTPPPPQPSPKKGCAVEPVDAADQGALALLGLGLLAGAARRRREDETPK